LSLATSLHELRYFPYISHELVSFCPSCPPMTITYWSSLSLSLDLKQIEGKNALFAIIGGFSINSAYRWNKVALFEKLSSESLPPSMNMPWLSRR